LNDVVRWYVVNRIGVRCDPSKAQPQPEPGEKAVPSTNESFRFAAAHPRKLTATTCK
jgi:hypothetical protein